MPTRMGPYWDDGLVPFLDLGERPLNGFPIFPAKGRNDVPKGTHMAVLTTHRICIFKGNLKPKELHWWFPLEHLSRIDTDVGFAFYGGVTRATRVTFVLTNGVTFVGACAGWGSRRQVDRFVADVDLHRRAR